MSGSIPRAARRLAALMLLGLLIGSLLPSATFASSAPTTAFITITKVAGGPAIEWHASGAIVDQGTWTRQIEQPSFSGGYHFVFGTLFTTMTGANGSFQLQWYGQDQEPIAPGAYDNFMVGRWEVVPGSGTGAYTNLQGAGAWTSAQAGTLITFTGTLLISNL
jgi:hypothetical protein